jgi:FkbM family methyltransferase
MLALASSVANAPVRRARGLRFVEPCYYFMDWLKPESMILDFGLGNDADFSMSMIRRIGLRSIGFDPTRRHESPLQELARRDPAHFEFHPAALGAACGMARFHESKVNISGSMLDNHRNVQSDAVESYEVPVVTLEQAIQKARGSRVDLIKIDVEGVEYDVIESTADGLFQGVPQWIIEFHHDSVANIPASRTRAHVRRFRELGFSVHTTDYVNFLFYQQRT